MTDKTVKTKRVLKNIDFSKDTSHIALVSTAQGGPCSGADYALVLKGSNFSTETIEKIQQIQVTMELPAFLEKFFHLYGSDAEVLARMMGYVEPEDDSMEETDDWYENYIQSRLDSFTILKSLKEADSITTVLSTLDEKQYLSMLTDQSFIEKALNKKESESVAKAAESDTSTQNDIVEPPVEPSGSKVTKSKGKQMTKPVDAVKTVVTAEQTSLEELQKSLTAQTEQLNKALETIAKFESDKKEQVIKSKTAQFQAVIKDETVLAPVLKAALALESDEDFASLLGAVTTMQAEVTKQKEQLEKSALFTEQGATVAEASKEQESAVARILKANKAKQTETK